MKSAYIEQAAELREFLMINEDLNQEKTINAICCCERVMENPDYYNCEDLDNIIEILYPNKNYDCVISEDEKQELTHRRLFRLINRAIAILETA